MKLGNSIVVDCSFRFQVLTNENGENPTYPDILVSFNDGEAPMVLKPHYPDSKYKRNLECLLGDSDFCAKLANSLYKKVSAALFSIEEVNETYTPNYDNDY